MWGLLKVDVFLIWTILVVQIYPVNMHVYLLGQTSKDQCIPFVKGDVPIMDGPLAP